MLYAAASVELKVRPVVTPSSRDVGGALQLLLSRMPRKDADLLRGTLKDMKRVDDERAMSEASSGRQSWPGAAPVYIGSLCPARSI